MTRNHVILCMYTNVLQYNPKLSTLVNGQHQSNNSTHSINKNMYKTMFRKHNIIVAEVFTHLTFHITQSMM